jgi:hypothetical protein
MMVGNVGAPATVDISYCDIQGLSAGVVVNSGSAVNWGSGNVDLDPQFTGAGQMESFTEAYTQGDYHLREGSGCIDAGDPDFVADAGQTDIDGDARASGMGVDIGADEVAADVLAIHAKIKIKPRALNRKSKGKWMLCSIELEDGYNVSDIVVDSIALNDEVKAIRIKIPKRKHKKKLHVAFNRSQVQDLLADAGRSALLTVTGSLQDGTTFQGQETIKIAGRHHNKKHGKVCKK